MRLWFAALIIFFAVRVSAEDWPRWRGPRGDGTWHGPKLPDKWPEGGLKPKWKIPIGGGYSGVTVVGEKVFVMDRQKEPEFERVLCFDADSGQQIWKHQYPVEYGKLFTVGALGECRCLDATTGEKVWSVNYLSDLKGRLQEWGFAGSALIDGDNVIVQPGGKEEHSIAALNRHTGKVVWQSHSDHAGYSTPMIVTHNDRRQLICWTPSHIRGLDPANGKPFWQVPYEITYGVAIAEPIFQEGLVLVCGYWNGSKAIRLGAQPQQAELAWEENKFLRGLMSQPLYRDGHVYLLDKQYGLTCFELTRTRVSSGLVTPIERFSSTAKGT
ncbi:MAG: hypothetical protein FD138_1447 [Planctomycetota bacterium]|nr:MAG: hypothetical protein FD138_1447 [Planctomycetota bacterium]